MTDDANLRLTAGPWPSAKVIQLLPEKPEYFKPNFVGVPDELKAVPNWVAWRAEPPKPGKPKWRKVPYAPLEYTDRKSAVPASSTDPKTWRSFKQAVQAYRDSQRWKRPFNGIGFVFDGNVGDDELCWCGIDLDAWTDRAQAIVAKLATYTEISPSGNGVHMIIRTKPFKQEICKSEALTAEAYCTGRYFTFTGLPMDGSPTTIEARPDEVAEVVAEIAATYDAAQSALRAAEPGNSATPSGPGKNTNYTAQLRAISGQHAPKKQKQGAGVKIGPISDAWAGVNVVGLSVGSEPLNLEKFKEALWGLADGWLAAEGNWMMVCIICANEAMRNGAGETTLKEALWEVLDERSRDVDGYDEDDNRDRYERCLADYGKRKRQCSPGRSIRRPSGRGGYGHLP